MLLYRTEKSGYDAISYLAFEGVRPLYRELLRQVRMYDELFRFVTEWSAGFLKAEGVTQEESASRNEAFVGLVERVIRSYRPTLSTGPLRDVSFEAVKPNKTARTR